MITCSRTLRLYHRQPGHQGSCLLSVPIVQVAGAGQAQRGQRCCSVARQQQQWPHSNITAGATTPCAGKQESQIIKIFIGLEDESDSSLSQSDLPCRQSWLVLRWKLKAHAGSLLSAFSCRWLSERGSLLAPEAVDPRGSSCHLL